MKLTLAAALLAALVSPSLALDWNDSDPVAQAQADLKFSAQQGQPAPSSSVGRPGGGSAGQFDSYVFALEWTPAFCEGKPGLPECAGMNGRFDAKNLALHGLWPDKDSDSSHNYGYCGVGSSIQALDKAATWCRMPAPGISSEVMSRLTTAMPGTASCLQNHEWYKHGSCSGFSPDEYFTRASALVEQVAAGALGRFVASHVGQTVSADDMLSAFESDFGSGSRRYVSLSCTKGRAGSMLLDVRLHLANPLRPASELAKMLLPTAGSGNCPPSFLLDPAGQ